ncbi:MAG TPA: DUF3152 domain-containing protein [Micromonosporaceae bacterium]|jgi:hypothetical protein|nr:DUF3152 domain-containing protein [Micromonosporaceae bacterium]
MSSRHRARHRRSRNGRYQALLAALAAVIAVGGGVFLFDRYGPAIAAATDGATFSQAPVVPSGSGSEEAAPSAEPSPPPLSPSADPATEVVSLNVPFPHSGPQKYQYASTTGPVLGTSGPIRTFRLAIESNISVVSMAEFTAKVDATLGDARSWIAGGSYRLQQVPQSSKANFTIYLVTASTTNKLCAPLPTNSFTSCRNGAHVVLNLDRYMTSVSAYRSAKISLDIYRTYMINHEVGHALGHGHQLCPAKGAPAPVMEQQTLGLHGCTANPWPYVDGKLYSGPSGSY